MNMTMVLGGVLLAIIGVWLIAERGYFSNIELNVLKINEAYAAASGLTLRSQRIVRAKYFTQGVAFTLGGVITTAYGLWHR
jgi:hypothetical protein